MTDDKNFVPNCADLLPKSTNGIAWKRILAVGDIHGHFKKLLSLYEKLQVTDDDFVIFLGDYIDRGPEVGEVLEWVMKFKDKKNFVFLRGNHEDMMLSYLYGEDDWWKYSYGQITLPSLKKWFDREPNIYDDFVHFITHLPLYYKLELGGKQYIFCHAGIEDGVPLEEQKADYLLWSRHEFFETYNGDSVVIVGHTPLQTLQEHFNLKKFIPFRVPQKNILMIDTGSFIDQVHYGFSEEGLISCVDILTGQFWQS
ncbi:MAG: serine/threonine protein phosphatase [Selenomonadaceae bacterium]|nr:serine/threonine protein phosphatase [Selenomonadaceae bacterium]